MIQIHTLGISQTASTCLAATLLTAALLLSLTWPPSASAAQSHAAAELGPVDVNDGFADLVEAVKPAVVNISTTSRASSGEHRFGGAPPEFEEFFRRFFGEPPNNHPPRQAPRERRTTAVGSGFIIDPDGLVVTNYHVIEDADEIEVVFDDGTRVPATLKGEDKKTDLALLQINLERKLPYLKFGDSDAARVGDWVVAIGNPFGLGGSTTSGIISARGRDIRAGPLDDFIQIDAPINRGNSGGPLFNTRGEVIGVNSAIYSPTGGSVGIGFAIPSSMASNVIVQLRDNGVVRRGYLGVYIQGVTEEIAESLGLSAAAGALVTRVVADSPAQHAGIETGDVVIEYNGVEVEKMRDLPKLVALTENQTEVEIVIWRDEKRRELQVEIGSSDEQQVALDAPSAASRSRLGLTVSTLNAENREQYGIAANAEGVVIVDIVADGTAAGRGLREGDLIKQINQRAVNAPDELIAAIQAARDSGRSSVLLLVERDERTRFVAVPLETK
ncbi:MAG: Do family serine endopeptidase [bacterium]